MDAILVADDEPGIRTSLAEVLRDAGYRVETAADGTAALEALAANDFGVVVTDLRMPGADGLAVLQRARQISPQTIVFLMTAHATIDPVGARLRAQARRLRRPARQDISRARAPAGRVGSAAAAPRERAALRLRAARREEPADGGRLPAGREGGADEDHGPPHRRERHRK